MTYPPAGQKVTRNGQTLTARMWSMLEASYAAAGLAGRLEVSQGSYKNGSGASASGSTHDGAGAADLRVVNLPSSARANLCERLVTELRRRGGCAWYRDEAHGGMSPHIHVILRDEGPLSSGAAQQVRDYDAGRNGLSNKGADYHPRPKQETYRYPPTGGDTDMPLTTEDVAAVANAVWNKVYKDPTTDADASTASLLLRTRRDANTAATRPIDGSGGAPVLSDADVDRIAARVLDGMAARMRE